MSARSIEVVASGVPAPRWRTKLARFCAVTLEAAGYSEWEIAILLCDDDRISALNNRYRGKDSPTDVLSFPRDEGSSGARVAGDMAISLPALRRNAASYGASDDDELKRIVVHGILHLAGMDHGRGKSGKMLALQETLLKRLRAERVIGE
jgi:probable rRNA maturation factor